jgi:hypothetical protein
MIKIQNSMNDEKKKTILDLLNGLLNKNRTGQLKRIIELFRINYKQIKIQKEMLMKILSCKAGQVPLLFMKWKALPSQTGKKYKNKALKF